ncbi:MAG: flagellin [Candidatus Gastranaerophilales bacterium]|nr:flagellin [Candidatus Gastranaerophilales bacterium]
MSVVVNTNISSLMVQRNLSASTFKLQTSMQRLSTGLRINSAADDAAGLALSEKLNSHIKSSAVTKSNAQTGINMLQVAESDLNEIQTNLQRIRDLAVQSANGVYSSSERSAINQEVAERLAEIDRISASSQFSDLKLLDGSLGTDLRLQIGTYTDLTANTVNIASAFATTTTAALNIDGLSVTTVATSRTAMDSLDDAITSLSERRSKIGASINRLQSTIDRIDVRKENLESSYSVIRDTDIAQETANLTKQQVLQQSGAMLLKQANTSTQIALSLLQS